MLTFSISFFFPLVIFTLIFWFMLSSNVVATWFEFAEALRTNSLNSVFPSLACGGSALRVTEGEEQRTRHLAPLLLKAGHLVRLQVVFTHNALHSSPPTAFGSLEAELCFWVEPSLFL